MKSECQSCQASLPRSAEAYHCSHDCTFCRACTERMQHVCPNCSGRLERRRVEREPPGAAG